MSAPDGADPRLSVCLSFDFDAMSVWIVGSDNPATISRGEFGPRAVLRLLDLLDRHSAEATFFTPGHTALAYPGHVREIVARGHEVGHHGWVHENPESLTPDREREVFARGLDALAETAGVVPTGYRSPGASLSRETIPILAENGIAYDSTCSGSDFDPYWLRIGDDWSKTGPFVFGERSEIVELPFSWILDDFPHFEFEPGFSTEQAAPSTVREIWQGEFDYAYEHCPGGVFVLTMHPQVIGRGHRITMLESLVEYMGSRDGVRFERMDAVAARWRSAQSSSP